MTGFASDRSLPSDVPPLADGLPLPWGGMPLTDMINDLSHTLGGLEGPEAITPAIFHHQDILMTISLLPRGWARLSRLKVYAVIETVLFLLMCITYSRTGSVHDGNILLVVLLLTQLPGIAVGMLVDLPLPNSEMGSIAHQVETGILVATIYVVQLALVLGIAWLIQHLANERQGHQPP